MLLIDNETTARVLAMPDVVAVLEQASRDLAAGEAIGAKFGSRGPGSELPTSRFLHEIRD